MAHWTKKFFVDDGKLWLYLMDRAWKHAPPAVRGIARILKKNKIPKGGRILEIACGNGRICTGLAKRGYDVTGIDISPVYIADAGEKAKKHKVNIKYLCGDIRYLDRHIHIKEKYDAVISIFTAIGYYDKETDEKIFKKVAALLKNNGLFLVLNTMSREWLSAHFCPNLYEDAGDYIIMHTHKYDRYRSQMNDEWTFYKKTGKDLKFDDRIEIRLRIYGQSELVEMAQKTGMEFVEAYDQLAALDPARPDSRINMVFKKTPAQLYM